MISQYLVKVLNQGVLVAGVSLSLVLPAMSAPSNLSNLQPVNSHLASSQEILIAQGGCIRSSDVFIIETESYIASICEDSNGELFYHGYNKYDDSSINVYGVTFTDSGYYMATTDDGYTFMVGDSLDVYDPEGNLILSEYAY
jgi:hypothetical protein